MELNRYVGQCVEIMYLDKQGSITQRIIEVRSIKKMYACAYCFTKKGLRFFNLDNVLAVSPAKKWSV